MTDKHLPAMMKAALCDAPGAPLRIAEIAVPVPGPGQYLVRLESCGICHSDLHVQRGEEPLPPEAFPLLLGHEGIGRIVAGEGPLPHGTRVGLPWLYETCLACDPCLTGRETFCPHQKARGLDAFGAFAEYALVEAAFATRIPEGIDPVAGGPLLCAGLTAWSALERCDVHAGQRLLVIGAGGLGQYAIAIGLARGLKVAVVEPDAEKRAEARRHGASLAVGPGRADTIRDWGGADITLNFAPTPKVWDLIAAVANPLSQIVAVALVHDPVPLSMMWLINGGHRVTGSSVGTRAELRAFLDFAADHPFSVPVEVLPFEEVGTGLERLARGEVRGRLALRFGAEA
ncbi:alcohol dehydrogenase catalytic domain-containing protein [Celeribacter indicus]|uniref:alcohol dehydrogenase n=1 Tax=Celeribacter indicus TaxID=1208324 RepID=A0A0B5E7Q8_9RHOB|nr:alcohol dehydrogenase catalytic domain-containing protein [Celeribacter indicus]AJE49091.1 alcohol dehydrogenase GroES domain-containing protein [Celeribacter indicus]SDW45688.1 alcohol dehydrogenase, propanol-preferring [Celeribacter indicus]